MAWQSWGWVEYTEPRVPSPGLFQGPGDYYKWVSKVEEEWGRGMDREKQEKSFKEKGEQILIIVSSVL